MVELREHDEEVSPQAVDAEVRGTVALDTQAADVAYLVTAMQSTPCDTRATVYGRMVLELSIRRRLVAGGMAAMPSIRGRLHELFGPERVLVPDNSATRVSQGAAWIAHDSQRLVLAKQIELEMARGHGSRSCGLARRCQAMEKWDAIASTSTAQTRPTVSRSSL
jgi:hypothetical protein